VKNTSSDSGNSANHNNARRQPSVGTPPEGGLEKSAAIERQIPSPGKDVEKKMGENMPDRK
jgi:hypothetical protein